MYFSFRDKVAEVSYDTQNPELILPESYTREELEEILL